MNLSKKKGLAIRTLKVGKKRIIFLESRLEEIKEVITKQDIRDLQKEGAIMIRDIKGKRKVKKKRKKSVGNIRKSLNTRKKNYVIMTRKLRKHVLNAEKLGKVSKEDVKDIRKRIRNKAFRSKSHLKEYIRELKK